MKRDGYTPGALVRKARASAGLSQREFFAAPGSGGPLFPMRLVRDDHPPGRN